MSGRLSDRTALVTGGSQGIGRAVALAMAAEGARVAVAARTVPALDEVAAHCGHDAVALALDVTDEHACGAAVTRAEEELGRIDILVNSAGVAESSPFLSTDTGTWRRIMAVDLDGPFWLIRATLPGMLERGTGAVVSIASLAARAGYPYVAAYTAAKHGLLGLTRSLAAEYARRGVTFNCVCPWYVDTPMTEAAVANIVAATGRTEEQARRHLRTPQGRLVRPDEVAEVCVLLASDAGRGINGQAINVDGGQLQS
jgi:NAD(P)-dependent dehydrogenase (short-subunit alcohol dehydrogenase family)